MSTNKIYIIAEIGINHNGSIDVAKQLIDIAHVAGCDAVKFQKRNPDVCVPEHQKSVMRETPWGKMTYLEYKYKVEFGDSEYEQIDRETGKMTHKRMMAKKNRQTPVSMCKKINKADLPIKKTKKKF